MKNMCRMCFVIAASLSFLLLLHSPARAQENPPAATLLWPSGAPMAQGTAKEDQPRLTAYLPKQQTSQTAIVVLPGGGYQGLATDHEGKQIAQWLNNLGIAAFVVEYRLGPKYHYPVELMDAQRGVRYIRANAAAFHIDPNRIGIWGFSAGGHLAGMVSTLFDSGDSGSTDPVARASSRPDFSILSYPVIEPLGSAGPSSYANLLGKGYTEQQVNEVAPDQHVTKQTPPAFLIHSDDDEVVLPVNSVLYYQALKKQGIPAEFHLFRRGGHGYGLAPYDPVLSVQMTLIANWLRELHFL